MQLGGECGVAERRIDDPCLHEVLVFTGERFLERCAPTLSAPEALVEGLHVFMFNQIAETAAWRKDLLARLAEDV